MDWIQFEHGVFLVNLLAIVYDEKTHKILIGRREEDDYIPELSWAFPGGKAGYDEELEHHLAEKVKEETRLDIEIEEIVFAKTYPEKREFLSIYYFCKCRVIGNQEKAGEPFKELKWVTPSEVDKYFTTSLHPKLHEYLKTLD
jgi:ADP-ribose pyrophosphatase YjhB (NUDIX family)